MGGPARLGRGAGRRRQDAARLIASFPPEHVPRQVGRVAGRLDLDHATVTGAVVDAITRDADAAGRLTRRDRRDDLDPGAARTPRAGCTGGERRPARPGRLPDHPGLPAARARRNRNHDHDHDSSPEPDAGNPHPHGHWPVNNPPVSTGEPARGARQPASPHADNSPAHQLTDPTSPS